jgi:hypothetical protein
MYYDTLLKANGCDSIISLNLTIQTPNIAVTQVGALLTANTVGLTYQWLQCNPFALISGANGQSYTATTNGDYAVVIYQAPCAPDTSDCYTVSGLSLDSEIIGAEIIIYPNPSKKQLYVYSPQGFHDAHIRLQNQHGQILQEFPHVKGERISIDLSALANGLYFIHCVDESAVFVRKVMKE